MGWVTSFFFFFFFFDVVFWCFSSHSRLNKNRVCCFQHMIGAQHFLQHWMSVHRRLRSFVQADKNILCPPEDDWDLWLPTESHTKTVIGLRMRRLVWVFSWQTCILLGKNMPRLILFWIVFPTSIFIGDRMSVRLLISYFFHPNMVILAPFISLQLLFALQAQGMWKKNAFVFFVLFVI